MYDISDHLPNFIIITKYTLPSSKKSYKRDSTYNESNLINNLNLINWEEIFGTEKTPDKLFDSFYDKISEIVDLHVPVIVQLSKKEMKTKSKPWITPAIQISI